MKLTQALLDQEPPIGTQLPMSDPTREALRTLTTIFTNYVQPPQLPNAEPRVPLILPLIAAGPPNMPSDQDPTHNPLAPHEPLAHYPRTATTATCITHYADAHHAAHTDTNH
jgi:hypothetical protein